MSTLLDNAYKSKVSELCLKKANPNQRDKVVIWVEGNDKRIYGNFFKENMVIFKGGGGCAELENSHNKLITMIPSQKQKSIIIRDADFKRLEKEDILTNTNIFYTDGHDLEMMMIKSKKVRERICVTYECPNCRNDFYDSIFDTLELLSYFKWYNYHYNRCYCFESLKIQDNLTNGILSDLKKIIDKLYLHSNSSWKKRYNKPFEAINPEDVSKFIKEHPSVDRYELTNGHDFLNGLCWQIKNKTQKYALNEERLKDPIIASFDLSEFQKTSLYKSLSNWGEKNNVDFLKKSNIK